MSICTSTKVKKNVTVKNLKKWLVAINKKYFRRYSLVLTI